MIHDGIQRNVFEYRDYRRFLIDFYDDQKSRKTGFTYANFAKKAGLKSPNYYKLVMDGEKNLTAENVIRFSKGLSFDGTQSEFFETLVNCNQAKSALEKRFYQERLFKLKMFRDSDEPALDSMVSERISHWLPHTLFTLSKTAAWKEDPVYLRQLLMNRATVDEITRAVQALKDGGLLGNKTSQLYPNSCAQSEESIQNLYESIVLRAAASIEEEKLQENVMNTQTVGVSKNKVDELKSRVRIFMRELKEWAQDSADTGSVYSLTFMGFPVTEKVDLNVTDD